MIHWTPEAVEDLERLLQFLLDRNEAAVAGAIQTIEAGTAALAAYPEMGRPLDDNGKRREVSLPFGAGAYVLRYRRHYDHMVVLRLWHSRESR